MVLIDKTSAKIQDISNIADDIPRIDVMSLEFGEHRGSGSFSKVYDIKLKRGFRRESEIQSCACNDESCDVVQIGNHVHYSCSAKKTDGKELEYVIKVPRQDKTSNIRNNIQNLLTEAKILGSLRHDHIIGIKGISPIDATDSNSIKPQRPYFIILENLSHTLDTEFQSWVEIKEKGEEPEDAFAGRLQMLEGIASAIHYLHSRNIIHRDIKPGNIGFTNDKTVKLFDFDLALQLNPDERDEDGLYDLPGGIGTCRFMAPEVAKFYPYNESADIYSFGLIIWYCLALEVPFATYSCKQWVKHVVFNGERPVIEEGSVSVPLQELLEDCWGEETARPDSFEVLNCLQAEIKPSRRSSCPCFSVLNMFQRRED